MSANARRSAAAALIGCAALAAGCGKLVDGQYVGDAALRLGGELRAEIGSVERPVVGALWLGFAGLADPRDGIDTTVLPIDSFALASFAIDVVGAPPDVGRYITADDSRIIPVTMRVARLALVDDIDGNGAFALDAAGNVAAPDRLLAVAAAQALVFVDQPPDDVRALDGAFLRDWEQAPHGYHLVQLDGTGALPDAAAHVIDPRTPVPFTAPANPVSW